MIHMFKSKEARKNEKEAQDLFYQIKESLNELEEKQIGRVAILTNEIQQKGGGWVNNEENSYYHPQTLPESENTHISKGQSYQVLSLINGHEGRVYRQSPVAFFMQHRNDPKAGIELVNRKASSKLTIDDYSNNNYQNEWSFVDGSDDSNINNLAYALVKEAKMDSTKFKEIFNKGIGEYQEKTLMMMDKAGAIAGRESLENQKFLGAESYLAKIRENLEKAKYNQ